MWRPPKRPAPTWLLAAALLVGAACSSSAAEPPADAPADAPVDAEPPPCRPPTEGLWATFRMAPAIPGGAPQIFHVLLSGVEGMASALDAWQQRATSTIPLGRLRCAAPVPWNCGWRWFLSPSTAKIVEATIELCDAEPPVLDEDCLAQLALADGLWCPWTAALLELRDCRDGGASGCPLVPR
jgi:hypothetical protein